MVQGEPAGQQSTEELLAIPIHDSKRIQLVLDLILSICYVVGALVVLEFADQAIVVLQ